MRRPIGVLALALLFITSCGAVHRMAATTSQAPASGVRVASPWPTLGSSPVATPQQVATAASATRASGARVVAWPSPPSMAPGSAKLALVKLAGSNVWVVRDVSDINHPSTLATIYDGPEDRQFAFVGPSDVAMLKWPYAQDGLSQLSLIRYPGQPQPLIETYDLEYELAEFRWSPDGSSVTFVVDTLGRQWEWHVVSGGKDRVISNVLGVCHCSESIQDRFGLWLNYSPDGRYMSYVVDATFGAALQVRTADGTLITEINPAYPNYVTMPVWSGSKLYFRDANGVEVWDNGVVSPFLPGVAWVFPQASPAGGLIAYSVPDTSSLPHVFTLEPATHKVQQLAAEGTHEPFFLSSRYIWYRGAQLCGPPDSASCWHSKYNDTGVTYTFDLQAGSEVVSQITGVADTWPHGR